MKRNQFIRNSLLALCASILVCGCNNSKHGNSVNKPPSVDTLPQNTFNCIDSTWGAFSADTALIPDTVEGGYVIGKRWKDDIDTSQWFLYKIGDKYHYYRQISYQCADQITEIHGDTAKIFTQVSPIYLGVMNCLVAHSEFQFCTAMCLFSNCNINDTIPTPMKTLYQTDTGYAERTDYYIGWMVIRRSTDTIKIKPDEKK